MSNSLTRIYVPSSTPEHIQCFAISEKTLEEARKAQSLLQNSELDNWDEEFKSRLNPVFEEANTKSGYLVVKETEIKFKTMGYQQDEPILLPSDERIQSHHSSALFDIMLFEYLSDSIHRYEVTEEIILDHFLKPIDYIYWEMALEESRGQS